MVKFLGGKLPSVMKEEEFGMSLKNLLILDIYSAWGFSKYMYINVLIVYLI